MNFGTLVTEAQRLAGRVDSDWNSRTKRFLNEAVKQWAIELPWPTLKKIESFYSDGSKTLVLPQRVLTIDWVGDKTNKNPLDAGGAWDRELPATYFGEVSGQALFWKDRGIFATQRDPAAIAPVQLTTTVSEVFSAYVSGLSYDSNASGTADAYYPVEEEVSITADGTYTTTNSYYQITSIGKNANTTGDVTVADSSGNRLARISKHNYEARYRKIDFLMKPPANTEIQISYYQRPPALVENYQVPPATVDTEYMIWYAASLIDLAQGKDQNSQLKRAHAEAILERRASKERGHGDQDIRSYPEPTYWGNEDEYTVPYNGNI